MFAFCVAQISQVQLPPHDKGKFQGDRDIEREICLTRAEDELSSFYLVSFNIHNTTVPLTVEASQSVSVLFFSYSSSVLFTNMVRQSHDGGL